MSPYIHICRVHKTPDFLIKNDVEEELLPLTKDHANYSYILTLQFELTKFTEAYPIVTKDTSTVAKTFVKNFVLRHGIPREIATDRGTEFISTTMAKVSNLFNITQTSSTPYHYKSIGALDNSHNTMGPYLRMKTQNQYTSWSSWLPYWCFAYNNTIRPHRNHLHSSRVSVWKSLRYTSNVFSRWTVIQPWKLCTRTNIQIANFIERCETF